MHLDKCDYCGDFTDVEWVEDTTQVEAGLACAPCINYLAHRLTKANHRRIDQDLFEAFDDVNVY